MVIGEFGLPRILVRDAAKLSLARFIGAVGYALAMLERPLAKAVRDRQYRSRLAPEKENHVSSPMLTSLRRRAHWRCQRGACARRVRDAARSRRHLRCRYRHAARKLRQELSLDDCRIRRARHLGGDTPMETSGQINQRGIVDMAFQRFGQVATVTGKLAMGSGSGNWSSTTMQCAGSWRATRQG